MKVVRFDVELYVDFFFLADLKTLKIVFCQNRLKKRIDYMVKLMSNVDTTVS